MYADMSVAYTMCFQAPLAFYRVQKRAQIALRIARHKKIIYAYTYYLCVLKNASKSRYVSHDTKKLFTRIHIKTLHTEYVS